MDERVLLLVFRRLNWDPHVLSVAARVSRRLRAVAKRVLWREACISRAPKMVAALTVGAPSGPGRVGGGGWHALAKLLFYCCGGRFPGHFTGFSRFSKTSGRSFLTRQCWGDLLYVSDPCEHALESGASGEDLGAYRGVFRGFMRSRTRACLIGRRAELEQRVRCPYCGARVWSMTAARLVPRSASRRLGSHEGRLEYFVCVSGHLHGYCWLAHLSSDENGGSGGDEDDDDDGHILY
ncbi:EID1-like F-box protein 3 [Apostasia shenzhenica]|uniref:EID1-like F-box protein 3 n=1 Tax=Apostasia shenzhenica TaxID=1088818 RepID=A0A2I0BH88_9ASPA|nr:EID1-like F-box protein 3 [Apostasia shenzhenica]